MAHQPVSEKFTVRRLVLSEGAAGSTDLSENERFPSFGMALAQENLVLACWAWPGRWRFGFQALVSGQSKWRRFAEHLFEAFRGCGGDHGGLGVLRRGAGLDLEHLYPLG